MHSVKTWLNKLNFRLHFSFGIFGILLIPLVLFQTVILFLFALSVDSGALDQAPFLIALVELLEFITFFLILLNVIVCVLGIIFDRHRVFATSSALLALIALAILLLSMHIGVINSWMPF